MISEFITSHSFIVKVWREETTEDSRQTVWRGRVTHVPSREQKYFQDLKELIAFIQRYTPSW